MQPRRAWAGIFSGGGRPPWTGSSHADRVGATIDSLRPHLTSPMIWGGDFNHALEGREHAGGKAGRAHVLDLIDKLGLVVPTRQLKHRIDGLLSIDHIAVAAPPATTCAERHDTAGLSDHDAYVVDGS